MHPQYARVIPARALRFAPADMEPAVSSGAYAKHAAELRAQLRPRAQAHAARNILQRKGRRGEEPLGVAHANAQKQLLGRACQLAHHNAVKLGAA